MSKIFVGSDFQSIKTSPKFAPISCVEILAGKKLYSAGDKTGRIMTIPCPWGTQQIANDVLTRLKGFRYQPFSAGQVLTNPAVEIGDALSIGGIYGGFYSESLNFHGLYAPDLSAPEDEEIDHEFSFISKKDREYRRELDGMSTRITIQDGKIEAEIKNQEQLVQGIKENSSKIAQNAESISAEVSARELLAGTVSENSTKITQNAEGLSAEIVARESAVSEEAAARGELEGTVNGIGTLVSEHSAKIEANTNGISAEIKARTEAISSEAAARGELAGTVSDLSTVVSEQSTKIEANASGITAEIKARTEAISSEAAARGELAGTVNGIGSTVSEHSAQISATSEALSAEITARESLDGVVSGHTSLLSQQADQISATVTKHGGDFNSFSWDMYADGMSWYANQELIFRLSQDGGDFTGKVTAKSGEIGGFTLDSSSLYTGNGSWGHCEPGEISISPQGINISEKFYVDSQGNLTCESGTFRGTVRAKQILYGGDDGELDGEALKAESLGGGKIKGSTISGGKLQTKTITGGSGGQLALGTIEGLNVGQHTLTGGTSGNLALKTVDSGNTSFGGTLSQVYTNTNSIADLGEQIVGFDSILNGKTQATALDVKGNLKGNRLYATSYFQCLGYAVKWQQIDPKTWALVRAT